ncbi:MAG: YidC/Oxa1 family insertase periplasmic-domain containing protein, partial [Prevotellaceae bacterium]|nr:YidC/Oxa1 family insertase periplasmic-domain containing protein [Prevotellaceae bacterium]
MDKNTGTGILLIVLIIGGYMWWNFKNTEEYQSVRRRVQDSISKIEKTREEFNTQTKISDSINRERQKVIAAENMGKMMTASLEGTESVYTVETEKLILAFSNKGGKIKSVEFKDYHNYSDFKNKSGNPMKLFFGDDNDFSLGLFAKSQIIKTSDFYFKAVSEERNLKVTDDSLRLPFRLYADSVSYVEFLYTLYKDKYKVGFD